MVIFAAAGYAAALVEIMTGLLRLLIGASVYLHGVGVL